jgi:predicted tellurium resistance membrane protein TerC
MLFLFAYGDIFGCFSPGQLQEVMAGEVSAMAITQVFLLAVSLYIAIASVMMFLSLVLRPAVNRWANIVLPSLYVVSIVASAIGERSAYYWFLSITESALLLLIVWYAWTWPRQVGTP